MANTQFMSNISGGIHRLGFKMKKHSPEILLATGIVSGVGCVIAACKATRKLDSVLESKRQFEEEFELYIEQNGYSDEYTEDDAKKDLAIVNVKTGWEVAKLYAPAVGLGIVSVVSILGSHNIIKKRYMASAAAYTATLGEFKEYRQRLVDRFGRDLDRELRYNIKTEEAEETVVNEDGTETVVKKTVNVVDPNTIGDYTAFFDDGCKGWSKDADYNLMFLRDLQAHWNNVLKIDRIVFLNDVRKSLGLPITKTGQHIGWIYDESDPTRDNFIDFGIYNQDSERARAFVNGHERVILLEFNCHGDVYDLMK